jgi:glucan 1,3-beta-glucosidase
MSRSSGVVYDPVPHADSHSPSSSPQPGFDPYAAYPPDSPYAQHHAGDSSYTLPPDLDDAPPRPRFMGAAAGRRDPTDPTVRASLASSNFFHDGGRGSEGSSVYALNDMSADGAEQHRGVSRMSSFQRYLDDPNHANSQSDHAHYGRNASPTSHHALGSSPAGATYMPEKRAAYAPGRRGGRRVWIIGGIVAGVLLLLAIAIPVAVVESKHKSSSNVSGDKKGGDGSHTATDPSGGNKSKQSLAVSGGAGSTVTTEDGSTFTYQNSFGGTWYYDENDPFNNAAQANSWTPPLNQSFVYGVNRIWGVNLGGWLNTEPFMYVLLGTPPNCY